MIEKRQPKIKLKMKDKSTNYTVEKKYSYLNLLLKRERKNPG